MEPVFDSKGRAIAWLDGDGIAYSLRGRPVAFLADDGVITYSGRFAGWLRNGYFLDRAGRVVGFLKTARGAGPLLPITVIPPLPPIPGIPPIRPLPPIPPIPLIPLLAWSPMTWPEYVA